MAPHLKSPAERIEEIDIPVGVRDELKTVCGMIFGDDCGHLENVRLTWQVPDPNAGQEADRDGWRVYQCDVVGKRFAVPHGAPIPMIMADEHHSDKEPVSIVYRYVHPDLLDDHDVLIDRLVQHVHDEIEEHLAALSTSLNLLAALHEMDELPFGASPNPYRPSLKDETIGYEPVDERPVESE